MKKFLGVIVLSAVAAGCVTSAPARAEAGSLQQIAISINLVNLLSDLIEQREAPRMHSGRERPDHMERERHEKAEMEHDRYAQARRESQKRVAASQPTPRKR
jgi:hypothetical protein